MPEAGRLAIRIYSICGAGLGEGGNFKFQSPKFKEIPNLKDQVGVARGTVLVILPMTKSGWRWLIATQF
jgi:hypothetical protein